MRDKILFLSQSYPDTSKSASTLCTHRVIKRVVDSGKYEIQILCYRRNNEKKFEEINGVLVSRTSPSIYECMRLWCLRHCPRIAKLLDCLRKIVTLPFYPNTRPISARTLYKKALSLCKENNFKLVVSEFHGLDTLLVGLDLVENNIIDKHIPILWDPIIGQSFSPIVPLSFAKKRIRRLERRTLMYSTRVISMCSMRHYYEVNGDEAGCKRVFLDIPGVLPPEKEVCTSYLSLLKDGYVNIVYSGVLTIPSRNPIPVLELLNQSIISEKVNVVFFCSGNANAELKKAKQWFKGEITIMGYISLPELYSIYSHTDFLLNISDTNASMTPSKIFEYMSYGKPIVSTYYTSGDSASNYLKNYPECVCLDLKESNLENLKILNAFLSKNHNHVSFDYVSSVFHSNTPDSYLNVISSELG